MIRKLIARLFGLRKKLSVPFKWKPPVSDPEEPKDRPL
jgi:hypothetical protein